MILSVPVYPYHYILLLSQILDEKLEFSTKAQSKVGSMDNADHQPSGGDVKVSILDNS